MARGGSGGGLVASGVPAGVGLVAGGVGASRRRALARVACFVFDFLAIQTQGRGTCTIIMKVWRHVGAARAQILM